MTELGMGNRLTLPDDEILKNVQAVQEANGIEKVAALDRCTKRGVANCRGAGDIGRAAAFVR